MRVPISVDAAIDAPVAGLTIMSGNVTVVSRTEISRLSYVTVLISQS